MHGSYKGAGVKEGREGNTIRFIAHINFLRLLAANPSSETEERLIYLSLSISGAPAPIDKSSISVCWT